MKEKVFGKIFFEVDFWGGDVLDIKIAVISNSLFKIDTATKKKKKNDLQFGKDKSVRRN